MRPESPIRYPSPEVIHDPVHPRTLLEYELNPGPLADLITQVRGKRHSVFQRFREPRRILLQGGLVIQHKITEPLEIQAVPLSSSIAMNRLFEEFYYPSFSGKWLAGSYGPAKQEIFLYPDTLLLAQIANIAESVDPRTSDEQTILRMIKDTTNQQARGFLIEEIEHSFEPLSLLAPILPFWLLVEAKAASKKINPHLRELTQYALALHYLAPDEQILELFAIARDSYQTFKEDSLKGY